jgi:uncharacterized repeat protein (TIGR03803 family)
MKLALPKPHCACILCTLIASPYIARCQATAIQLKSFGNPSISGAASQAPLVMGADGALYGTTTAGGNSGKGALPHDYPAGDRV